MKKSVKKTVKVKKSKQKVKPSKSTKTVRIPTNIPDFDKLIGGGFEKNSINLIVGGSGSGKTIFASQFLINSMKSGEKCLYITFEEKKAQFYENMSEFGWDLAEYEKKGLFTFLEYTPEKVKVMLEEGGGTIESIIVGKKISRLVIDSITSFALLFDDELEKREAALNLFSMISKWDCTSLLTLEVSRIEDEKVTSQALEFESDSIITMYFTRVKSERQRYIEILKMRGTNHSRALHKLTIKPTGIVIESRPAASPPTLF